MKIDTLFMMPIATKIVSSNPTHGEVYIWWFSPGPPVSFTNKTDRHDITKILLKVALTTIKQTNKKIQRTLQIRHLITVVT
jgi:hypothetical protein